MKNVAKYLKIGFIFHLNMNITNNMGFTVPP